MATCSSPEAENFLRGEASPEAERSGLLTEEEVGYRHNYVIHNT